MKFLFMLGIAASAVAFLNSCSSSSSSPTANVGSVFGVPKAEMKCNGQSCVN